mgnify:CR=1 FL=1
MLACSQDENYNTARFQLSASVGPIKLQRNVPVFDMLGNNRFVR